MLRGQARLTPVEIREFLSAVAASPKGILASSPEGPKVNWKALQREIEGKLRTAKKRLNDAGAERRAHPDACQFMEIDVRVLKRLQLAAKKVLDAGL